MKLKDIRIGMKVVDEYNNEYEVVDIDENEKLMLVKLKCIKFLKDILIQTYGDDIKFQRENTRFYIYKSRKAARKDGCNEKCITVKSLKLKDKSK